MSALQAAVLEHGADFGVAHDGDADRCLAVDASGAIIDGDQIMAILALSLKVATVMSNLGLRIAMKEHDINMIETGVGDRYVLEEMRAGGYTLGGEQSGHVIFAQYATTGDGILTGLKIGAEMARTKKTLAELASVMKIYPQVLINVPGVDKTRVDTDAEVQQAVRDAEAELHGTGRVLLRASGTEPLVRVMVEAADAGTAQSWAERIARIVEKQLAL
jgi:phosphoglucosamine mutase